MIGAAALKGGANMIFKRFFGRCLQAVFCTVAVLMAFSTCWAQSPAIENYVILKLTTPGGAEARSKVQEGHMLTVVDSLTGSGFAFLPTLGATPQIIEVAVFPITNNVRETKSAAILHIELGSVANTVDGFKIEAQAIMREFVEEPRKPNDQSQTCQSNDGK